MPSATSPPPRPHLPVGNRDADPNDDDDDDDDNPHFFPVPAEEAAAAAAAYGSGDDIFHNFDGPELHHQSRRRFHNPPFRIRLALPLPLYKPRSLALAPARPNLLHSPTKPTRKQRSACLPRTKTGRMFLLVTLLLLGSIFHYIWRTEAALAAPWTPDPGAELFAQRPLQRPVDSSFLTDDGVGYALPLQTKGRDVVDQRGRRFKLASVNWYGASDELFIPGGLDVQHRSVIAQTIRMLGFNSVRLPYADEMVTANPTILPHLLVANPDLIGLRALDVYEAVVTALTDAGIAVIINNHITSAQWCCGADPCDAGWANDHLGPLCRVRQTEDQWIEHWETVMARFVNNPRVIGADLRNEVRGVWGTMPWDKWATAAERAGNALLKMHPDWLIIVGGTESNNDLTGVAARPIRLDVAHRVVYSAHVYAWSGWGSVEGRYAKRAYPSFVRAMRKNWAYLVEGNETPVWIGEFGAPHHPGQGDANYWQNLMRYLKSIDADFGYWAINPRKPHDDAKESYSLVEDDWITPVLDYRMRDMTELMNLGKKP